MATPPTPLENWNLANYEVVKEAYRLGEVELTAQLTIALAADQRAAVLAGFFGTAATGVLGAIATTWSSIIGSAPVLVGSSATAIVFLVAAIFCIRALLPVGFWTPGTPPSEWYNDTSATLEAATRQQARFYNERISDNEKTLKENGWWLHYGAIIGVAAPVAGIVVAAVVAGVAAAIKMLLCAS